MWQSQAFAGAASLGRSLPAELGTACCAWVSSKASAPAVKAAAPLRNVRRASEFFVCMVSPWRDQSGDRGIERKAVQPARRIEAPKVLRLAKNGAAMARKITSAEIVGSQLDRLAVRRAVGGVI